MKFTLRTAVASAAALLIGLIAIGIIGYYALIIFREFPVSYELLLKIGLTLALGIAAVLVVQRILLSFLSRYAGTRRAGLLLAAYRIVAYGFLTAVVLVVAGVNSFAILAGGTFAGLVLGLAGQVALSNVIAGITLLAARPVHPGERVTLISSTYGLLIPSYSPKFFSQDAVYPGYTGVVTDLGLIYSVLRLDEGVSMKIPNSILIQAAILSHEVTDRWVRVKYEIPHSIDPQTLIARLEKALPENEWVVQPEKLRVQLNQATLTSYVISVDAICRGSYEDAPRSSLLIQLMKVVKELTPPQDSTNTPP
ncbi:MAG: mechanosensitive ion channel family protein [Thermoplasmata archaeon]